MICAVNKPRGYSNGDDRHAYLGDYRTATLRGLCASPLQIKTREVSHSLAVLALPWLDSS